jgi:hypothetical protein
LTARRPGTTLGGTVATLAAIACPAGEDRMWGLGIVMLTIGILGVVLPFTAPQLLSGLITDKGEFAFALAGVLLFGIGFALLLRAQRRRRERRMQGTHPREGAAKVR